ncbi:RDD family protein [Mycoplasma corogypsi]|uniref:RDD family protein n=1 Tax=Mycoplasma corogypsi TaxID=2106 RepID=UPI003873324E
MRRFLANVADFAILAGSIWLLFYIVVFKNKILTDKNIAVVFYTPIILWLVWLNFYLVIYPIWTKGQTLMYQLFQIMIIDTQTKQFSYLAILKRNYLLAFYLDFILLLALVLIYPSDIIAFDAQGAAIHLTDNQNIRYLIASKFIYVFMTVLAFIVAVTPFVMIFNKKKLSLIDLVSHTRVVYKNIRVLNIAEEIVFYPFKSNLKNYYYTFKNKQNQITNMFDK